MVWKAVLPLSCLLAVAAAQNASNTSSIPEAATTATSTEGVCAFDDGIDFIGNDIKNVPGKSAGDCCSPCQATLGCGAFTWSNFNGGTCWLKSSKGQVTFASGVKSGVVQQSGLEVDTDYIGNDVSNTLASKADDCFDKCKSTSGCKAFSWNNFNGGTCWLKSGRGEVRSSKGVYSAVVGSDSSPTPPAGKCVVEKDVDYTGYDMGNVPGVDATACCSKCSGITGCKAFSWSGWNGGTCWLKSARGKAVASPGVSSGVISNPPPEQCSLKTGEDYVGNDIGSSPSATAAECCELCRKKDGCHAFTWTDWNNGVCWFKSSRGEIRPNPSAVSGVVDGNSADSRHVQYSIRSGAIPARSVNLGSWLVTEYWMSYTSPLYKGVPENIARAGEYAIMKYLGTEQGTKQFEEHRSTWLTEEDIAEIASTGLNTVRVPVGFWIVDDDSVNPPTDISRVYARGGLKYLDKLINQWAVKYNLAVMLSLHAHQGSQNGYDHSAPQEMDKIEWWRWPNNIENSLRFATYLAARYKDAPAFLGLNLMNEPSGDTRQDVLEKYYLDAYQRIRANGNSCVIGTSPHLWYQDQWQMREFMRWPAYTNVWQEYHVYYKWGQFVSIPNILDAARNYYKGHFDDWPGNWQYMGEWSLATPDSLPINDRNTLKEFAAIQLEQYSRAHAGWAFWAWRHDDETITQRDKNFLSAWCMRQLLREGIFTVPK